MTLDELPALLPGAKPVRRGGFVATCPSHDDSKPSLSFKQGDKGIVLHCFADCNAADVTGALGLKLPDLFNDEPERVVVRALGQQRRKYEIRDAGGLLKAVHERVDRSGGKDFYWYRADGTPGLNGTAPDDLPLYGTEHIASWPAGTDPLVVEGGRATRPLGSRRRPSHEAIQPFSGPHGTYSPGTRLRGDSEAVRANFGAWLLADLPDDQKARIRSSAMWGTVITEQQRLGPPPDPIAQPPAGRFQALRSWRIVDPDLAHRARINAGQIVDASDELFVRFPHLFTPVIEDR